MAVSVSSGDAASLSDFIGSTVYPYEPDGVVRYPMGNFFDGDF